MLSLQDFYINWFSRVWKNGYAFWAANFLIGTLEVWLMELFLLYLRCLAIYETFKQKYPERLYPTIEKIFQQFSREPLMLPCRGERLVLLSLLQVNTLISDIPVDPVEAKKAKIAFLQEEIDSSTASIIVDAEFDMMQSGSVSYANYTSRRVEVNHKFLSLIKTLGNGEGLE